MVIIEIWCNIENHHHRCKSHMWSSFGPKVTIIKIPSSSSNDEFKHANIIKQPEIKFGNAVFDVCVTMNLHQFWCRWWPTSNIIDDHDLAQKTGSSRMIRKTQNYDSDLQSTLKHTKNVFFTDVTGDHLTNHLHSFWCKWCTVGHNIDDDDSWLDTTKNSKTCEKCNSNVTHSSITN